MIIGSYTLSSPLVLAPMAGVTDPVFRELCARCGAALTVSEMVSAKGLHYQSENTRSLLLPADTPGVPQAVQLFGSEPEILAEAAASEYLRPFQIIDINMGCPARKITSNGEGSALMKDIPLAYRILRAVVKATDKPVTVKCRAGWDSVTAPSLAQAAEDAGCAAIAVHGRTAVQGYTGTSDPDVIAKVKASVRIPVIGNGDVRDGASAKALLSVCDAVMVGRACQGKPWIFSELLAVLQGQPFSISPADALSFAREHGLRISQLYGERNAMLQMRKHLSWYTRSWRGSAALRAEINALQDTAGFLALLSRLDSIAREN